jgi:hypothetical protein
MPSDDPNEAEPGKLKTPCERMHLAYSTSSPPEDEPPAVAAVAGVAVVVVLRLATPAVGEPPQAAVARARPMTPGATSSNRRTRIPRVYTWGILPLNEEALPGVAELSVSVPGDSCSGSGT